MEPIPIRMEVNEQGRSIFLRVPWAQLSGRSQTDIQAWREDVDRVARQSAAKGYRIMGPVGVALVRDLPPLRVSSSPA